MFEMEWKDVGWINDEAWKIAARAVLRLGLRPSRERLRAVPEDLSRRFSQPVYITAVLQVSRW
jgi:hypothetical protein